MSTWNLKNPAEQKAISTLSEETDRGAAIIAATYLENRLTQGLKCRFRRDTGKATDAIERLVGDYGALDFTAKIKLGYVLRLYGKQVYSELDTIREVRNKFAHLIGEEALISFEEPGIVKLCRKLKLIEQYVRPIEELPVDYFSMPTKRTAIEAVRHSGESYGANSKQQLENARFRYTETCGLLAERFQDPDSRRDPQLPDDFLILGDEPYPLP